MGSIKSKNGVSIHLSAERWFHISSNHDDLASYYEDVLNTVENPDYIIRGYRASLIALRRYGKRGFLAVVYKELSKDEGYILTAYFTRKVNLNSSVIIWQKK